MMPHSVSLRNIDDKSITQSAALSAFICGYKLIIIVTKQVGFEVAWEALQQELLSWIRDPNRALPKQLSNPVVDVTANLHMTSRLVCPNEETEIQRIVAKLEKLHIRLGVAQNIGHVLRRFDERISHELNVGIVRHSDRYRDARAWIAIRPVYHSLAHQFRIRHDDGNP